MSVCCECCVLSGRCLCDELITRPEESYRLWYVVMCDLETSRMRRPWPALGRRATGKTKYMYKILFSPSFHDIMPKNVANLRMNCLNMLIMIFLLLLFPVALQPNAGHGLLILEVSRSHTTTRHKIGRAHV